MNPLDWHAAALAIGGLLLLGVVMFVKKLAERINSALVDGIVDWFKNVNAMSAAVVEINNKLEEIDRKFDGWKADITNAVDTKIQNLDLRLRNVESLHVPRAGEAGSITDRKLP